MSTQLSPNKKKSRREVNEEVLGSDAIKQSTIRIKFATHKAHPALDIEQTVMLIC